MDLLSKEKIQSMRHGADGSFSGVYFLFSGMDDEIVYVGSSKDILSRLIQHRKEGEKEFDGYTWITCATTEMEQLELNYILLLRPKYNRVLPRMTGLYNLKKIAADHGDEWRVSRIKQWMKGREITPVIYNGRKFYDPADFVDYPTAIA